MPVRPLMRLPPSVPVSLPSFVCRACAQGFGDASAADAFGSGGGFDAFPADGDKDKNDGGGFDSGGFDAFPSDGGGFDAFPSFDDEKDKK